MSFFGKRQPEPEQPKEPERPRPVAPQPPPAPTTPSVPTPAPTVGFETVLGANSVMSGELSSSANVRLDGTFSGQLNISGNVLIGETAKINADVNAKNISIAGAVRGNVNGKKVQILRTGRVWGDINAQALSTEEGAFIDGKISMQSKETPAPVAEPAPAPEPSESTDEAAEDDALAEPDFLQEDDDDNDEERPE